MWFTRQELPNSHSNNNTSSTRIHSSRSPYDLRSPRPLDAYVDKISVHKGKSRERTIVKVREATSPFSAASTSLSPPPFQTSSVYRTRSSVLSTSEASVESCCCCDEEEHARVGNAAVDGRRRLDRNRSRNLSSNGEGQLRLEEEEEEGDGDESMEDNLSNISVPSLSPSRLPLFDDDSEEEDDYFPLTPTSLPSLSTSSYSPSPSSYSFTSPRRRLSVSTLATTDPLVSPPLEISPPLEPAFSPPHPALSSYPVTPTKSDTTSLLTKSLRSLVRLPNLSLPTLTRPSIIPILSSSKANHLELTEQEEGKGMTPEIPWEWRGSRSGNAVTWRGREKDTIPSSGGKVSILRGAGKRVMLEREDEAIMVVQLQTFSPMVELGRIGDEDRVVEIDLDELTPTPGPVVEEIIPIIPPSVTNTPLRIVSNQRHLLMLSLEIKMMKEGKIVSPLRPRAVIVIGGGKRGKEVGSALKWEIRH